MELDSKYNPTAIEEKWYSHWMEQGYFYSTPDQREPYTIVIPPPNVTGVLHMGHMLNNTIQDVLVRRARMQGKNACWVPGTDHASIATEAKVVKMLEEQGVAKKDLGRENFLQKAFEWKEKYGGIILEQLKKLGASCDWNRTRFTMEPKLYDAVIEVFVDLYEKGLIYRGTRMVNWDPKGKTTLSDEEVIFQESKDKLYYAKYFLENSTEFLPVATARPETIGGDVAVCVNPNDERYKNWVGKKVIVPLINRAVPIITDEYIDIEFGTGALKVTPAHDIHDYEIGLKNNLPVIDTLNEDGTMSENAGVCMGMDRFEARKWWERELENQGLLIKVEEYIHNVGRSERTNAIVEPRISTQWFLNMKEFMQRNPQVLEDVLNDKIRFTPAKLKNTYKHWIENIRDWNISRQLWWGHRIPAWYTADGQFEVAKNAEAAANLFAAKGIDVAPNELKQDEDVLDTWFSSWLWPISVFDGFENPDNEDIKYYYPTHDLVTAPEIIFFWVMRMIMAGYEYKGQLPFKNVYFTGIVRDKLRRKMSKSLGNSPDPLDLIAKYGADAVRMGMLLCSPAGNDILYDDSQVEQGRNFCNKLWNALRLLNMWETKEKAPSAADTQAYQWLNGRMEIAAREIENAFAEYRLNDALMCIYKLIWDDYCAVYLEAVKPAYGEPISETTKKEAEEFMRILMRYLHPFMPFITEEIYHQLKENNQQTDCIIASYPSVSKEDASSSELVLELISQIRNFRTQYQLSPKEKLDIFINGVEEEFVAFSAIIEKLGNVEIIAQPESLNYTSCMVGKSEVFFVKELEIDAALEIKKIEDEIQYLHGFLRSVEAKLGNEKFMANAKPDIIEKEQQKKNDALQKIDTLQLALNKFRQQN